MSLSMHTASVPVFVRMLGNLLVWLDKAEAHATEHRFDPSVYLVSRLAPDMLPFTKQIQIACDSAKFGVARLVGMEAPKFEDNETNLAELRERVRKTLTFVQSVAAERIQGTDDRDVVVPRRDGSMTLRGDAYLTNFVLPNFYFHLTTTYALLRHNGVPLGKSDYLGPLQ